MMAQRPLKSEDVAVLQRISLDLDRDRILAEALGQRQLASEIDAVLGSTRRIIAGAADVQRPSGVVSLVTQSVPQSDESLAAELASVPASLLYLAADIEPFSPPAADLCRAAAELLEVEQNIGPNSS